MDKEQVELVEKAFIEEQFANEQGYLIQDGEPMSIFISAPHSVSQWRKGKVKIGEYKTGVLVELLHQELQCPAMYKTKNMQDDANWDEDSTYKEALMAYIKKHNIQTLYDIHISSPKRDFDVDLGTGYGKYVQDENKVARIIEVFQANGLEDVKVNAVFSASRETTVTATVARLCGIDCIQFEINWKHLDTSESFDGFEKVYQALKTLIEKEGK